MALIEAVNGKMLKGMYPTADRDIKMQVNPAGADADAYDWAFVSTDNTTPWGLNFGAPQAWLQCISNPSPKVSAIAGDSRLLHHDLCIFLHSEHAFG